MKPAPNCYTVNCTAIVAALNLSLLLSNLLMDGLLGRLENDGYYEQAYADYGVVMITGKFIAQFCSIFVCRRCVIP